MTTNMDFLACPLPDDVRRIVAAGDFDRAKKVIGLRLANPRVPEMIKDRLRYELRVIDELPREYPYTEEQALERLKQFVAGITRDEMDALRDDGTLDFIYVNGQVRYKDDCCESLVKTRVDLNPRILDGRALALKYENFKMLDEIIARMKKEGHVRARYRMRTTLTIAPEAQRPGELIRVHMALPLRDAQCTPGEVLTCPKACVAPETAAQRTACFEEIYQPGMAFVSEFSFDIDAR
ncbi:MAG: hypothetical protein GX558_11540, partial [Clostridiales bacterium]|nr:hypothetical protein [Clostridiales bacterium]